MKRRSTLGDVMDAYRASDSMNERLGALEAVTRTGIRRGDRRDALRFITEQKERYGEMTRFLSHTDVHERYLQRFEAIEKRLQEGPTARDRIRRAALTAAAAAVLTFSSYGGLNAPTMPPPTGFAAKEPTFHEYVDHFDREGMVEWPLKENRGISSLQHRLPQKRYADVYFGERRADGVVIHDGNDLSAIHGDTVRALEAGVVLRSGYNGLTLAGKHFTASYIFTRPLVMRGDSVAEGQAIGTVRKVSAYPSHLHVKVTDAYGVPADLRLQFHHDAKPLDLHCLVSEEVRRTAVERTDPAEVSELKGRRHLGASTYERFNATCRPTIERLAKARHFPDAQVAAMPEIRMPRIRWKTAPTTRYAAAAVEKQPLGVEHLPEPEVRLAQGISYEVLPAP